MRNLRTHVHVVYPVTTDGPSIVAEVVLDGRVSYLETKEGKNHPATSENTRGGVSALSANLQLVEEQSEVKDLSELLGQRLLALQRRAGERGRVEGVGELRQQALQNLL